MMGQTVINQKDNIEVEERAVEASENIQNIQEKGFTKSHLSKEGKPEHIYFPLMPNIAGNNPNNSKSINKLKSFGENLKNNIDAVIFLGVGGSYLGNKVLFDIFAGDGWNSRDILYRNGYSKVYFSGNNLDVDQYSELAEEIK